MDTCSCIDVEIYYDIEFLKKSKRNVDSLIENIRFQNPNLKNYYRKNNALRKFNDITLQLVKDFKSYAESHVKFLMNNKQEYGILYLMAFSKQFNLVHIEYTNFPLISQKEKKNIMKEIEEIAQTINNKNNLLYSITCIELLFFYALLVNPEYNWVIMDYISFANKNHQYVILD